MLLNAPNKQKSSVSIKTWLHVPLGTYGQPAVTLELLQFKIETLVQIDTIFSNRIEWKIMMDITPLLVILIYKMWDNKCYLFCWKCTSANLRLVTIIRALVYYYNRLGLFHIVYRVTDIPLFLTDCVCFVQLTECTSASLCTTCCWPWKSSRWKRGQIL